MADVGVPVALSAEFPQADHGDWLELAGDVERLRTTTYDGITIEPLYTAGDPIADAGLPGFQPFVRGRTAAGTRDGWDIRQLVDVSRGQGRAVAELERGATSVWLRFGGDGAFDQPSLERVLDGVHFDIAPIVLDAGSQWLAAARGLRVLWERQGVDRSVVGGSFGADPFGDWADHRDATRLDADLRALAEEAGALSTEHPNVRVATIDGTRFHDAGASDAQELGVALAGVVATLRTLTAGGLDVASAFGQLEVRLAATVEQFATIAKFRAARRLLARVAEVAGEPTAAGSVPLHAVTSRPMVTRYDRAVNIVRATIACFAAAVGGADAVTVLPHDSVVRRSASELATRLARNTHAVLAMESNIARVVDPAGGSWYVEQFTAALAQRAWDVFQEIEAAGGFRAAVEAGIVADRIATTRATRGADVDHRRAPIVGVSAFPSLDDVVPTGRRTRDRTHVSLGGRLRGPPGEGRRRRRCRQAPDRVPRPLRFVRGDRPSDHHRRQLLRHRRPRHAPRAGDRRRRRHRRGVCPQRHEHRVHLRRRRHRRCPPRRAARRPRSRRGDARVFGR